MPPFVRGLSAGFWVRGGWITNRDAERRLVWRSACAARSLGDRELSVSHPTLLPFQPGQMSPGTLAAVAYLARYSGHTRE